MAEPRAFPSEFGLPSGKVVLANFVGISDAERDFAKAHGGDKLIEKLQADGCSAVTDPFRASVV